MNVAAAIAVVLATFIGSVSLTLAAIDIRRRAKRPPGDRLPSLADECSPWSDRETR